MKKGKIVGSILASTCIVFLSVQVSVVSAHGVKDPTPTPLTSPITAPTQCRPGWGFGDKNHCHSKLHDFIEKCLHFRFGHDKDHDHDKGHGHDRH